MAGRPRVQHARNTTAAEAAFEANRRRLFAYCFRMLGDAEAAEDALGETAARVWRLLQSRRACDVTAPLLFAVCSRVAHESLRRRRRDGRCASPPEAAPDDPAALVLAREGQDATASRVREAVAALPPRLREVIVLRYGPDTELSASEIAEALRIHKSTVHRRLHDAERALARSLADLGADVQPDARVTPESARAEGM